MIKDKAKEYIFSMATAVASRREKYGIAVKIYDSLSRSEKGRLGIRDRYNYAKALFKRGRFEDALREIDEAIDASDTPSVKQLCLRAETYIRLDEYGKAEQDLVRVLKDDREVAVAHYLMGLVHSVRGSAHLAKESLQTAKSLHFSSPNLDRRLGQAYLTLGEYDIAADLLERAAKQWTSNPVANVTKSDFLYLAGLSCEKNGNENAARDLYSQSMAYDRKYGSKEFGIGVLHEKYKNYDLAKSSYEKDATAKSLYKLGRLYAEEGDPNSAIVYLKQSLRSDMTNVNVFYETAKVHELLGDYKEAASLYRHAILRDPDLASEWYIKWIACLERVNTTTEVISSALKEASVVAGYLDYIQDDHPRREKYNYMYENLDVDESVIVFESMTGGRVSGSPQAIYEHLLKDQRVDKNTCFVWCVNELSSVPDELKNLENTVFIKRYTDAYYKYLALAGTLINDSAFPSFYIKKDTQKYLNMWHGTPWKTLGYDFETAKMDYVNAARNFLQASHLLVPNQFTLDHQLGTHQVSTIYPGELTIAGYPRIDFTYESMRDPRLIREQLGLSTEKKVILYAPTWRGKKGARTIDTKNIEDDLKKLSDCGAQILFRGHYLVDQILDGLSIPNVTVVPGSIDMNKLLGATDVLITDYSSTFFDFLVTDKPIIHYVHDYDEYIAERGLYFGLEELPGDVARTREDMVGAVRKYTQVDFVPTKVYKEAKEKYVYKDDGKVTGRVVDWFIFGKKTMDIVPKDNRKKILFHAGGFQMNGITTTARSLIKAIDRSKYNIVVTLADTIMYHPERIEQLDKIKDYVSIIPRTDGMNLRPMSGHEVAAYKREFQRVYGSVEFDFVIDFSGYSTFFNNLLLSAPGDNTTKSVYLHNDIYSEFKHKYPKLDAVFRNYHDYDNILSVSAPTNVLNRDNLAKQYDIEVSKFNYIDNLQDTKAILSGADGRILAQDDPLFVKNKRTFLSIGRLSAEKDHEKLVRAFSQVYENDKNTTLLIIGEGPLRDKLHAVIKELGLMSAVHLLGVRENPYPYIKRADCFVLPSNYEGQPVVLFEAMVLKKPIIATDIVSNRGVVESGYGYLCENSIDGLVDALRQFMSGNVKVGNFDMGEFNTKALRRFEKLALKGES